MAKDAKDNKKGFFKYTGDNRKGRKNVGPLLNEMGDLVTQDMVKAEAVIATFASPITSKTGLQESLVPETKGKG